MNLDDKHDPLPKISRFKPKFERLRRVREAKSATIVELCRIAGLNPRTDFRYADLRGVDWRGTDVSAFDLSGALPSALLEIETKLAELRAAHRALDERIEQLLLQGFPDQLQVQRLKKQRLAMTDRIGRLEKQKSVP
jgi:hypothetical protein